MTPEDLYRLVFAGDPQIAPDGTRILFGRKTIDAEKNKYRNHLWTVDMEGNTSQLTFGEASTGGGRWSPSGGTIAFVSGREEKIGQIFLLPMSGGEARKLTQLPEGSPGELKWSPDGNWIAFTFRATDPSRTAKAAKEREASGASEPPLVTDTLWYRLDGDGYFGADRFKLMAVEVATGETRVLCESCVYGNYAYDWSPDSKELIVAHSVHNRPFESADNDQLFRIDLNGQAWMLEDLPKGAKGTVRWSPDGKTIAYAARIDENDPWGVQNVRVWTVPAEGGTPKCLTANDDYCLSVGTLSDSKEAGYDASLFWSPDSKAIYIQTGDKGTTQLAYIPADKGGIEFLTKGQHVVMVGNSSRDGERIACLWGNATKLMDVAVYDLSEHPDSPRILTHLNQDFYAEITIQEPEEIWLDSTDDSKLHGWVIKPVKYLEPNRYPAVLQIHGGPHAQYGWAFFHEFQVLAAAGYVVVYTNPRGSKGYGEAYVEPIRGKWGGKDWEDIQTVTRWMQHQPYIHPGRMGVGGGSYGGYMTNWVIGHCQDFKAAITDRCVSNMISMGGNSDFPIERDGYWKGVFYGDIKDLWEQSPIAYFENVKTPTLVIHSEGDLRCNIEQGEQVFSALQMQGIESRLVRYPKNTSHGMSRSGPPDLRIHRLKENLNWWNRHLG